MRRNYFIVLNGAGCEVGKWFYGDIITYPTATQNDIGAYSTVFADNGIS